MQIESLWCRWMQSDNNKMNNDDICLNIDTSAAPPRAKKQKKVSKLERVSYFMFFKIVFKLQISGDLIYCSHWSMQSRAWAAAPFLQCLGWLSLMRHMTLPAAWFEPRFSHTMPGVPLLGHCILLGKHVWITCLRSFPTAYGQRFGLITTSWMPNRTTIKKLLLIIEVGRYFPCGYGLLLVWCCIQAKTEAWTP